MFQDARLASQFREKVEFLVLVKRPRLSVSKCLASLLKCQPGFAHFSNRNGRTFLARNVNCRSLHEKSLVMWKKSVNVSRPLGSVQKHCIL